MLKMYLHVQASMLCITGYYEIFENFEPKITKIIISIFPHENSDTEFLYITSN